VTIISTLMRTQHHVDGRRVAAGKEEAEDSDDEINEDLDVDAAADAFAAAAREKGFGNGSQHPGTSDFPYGLSIFCLLRIYIPLYCRLMPHPCCILVLLMPHTGLKSLMYSSV